MKVVAIIQARTGSTRLPGKVLKPLAGQTVLEHVIARVKAAGGLQEIIIATTTHPDDDAIAELARRCDVPCFRGSQDDVLSRYYLAAKQAKADNIVRVTSDCPLFDPELLSHMLQRFLSLRNAKPPVDYLSNSLVRSFPRGLDAEIFTFSALEKTYLEARRPYEREHVTPYIYQHPELFALVNEECLDDLSAHRWTLDTKEDLELIERIYAELHRKDVLFNMQDVLNLLSQHPEWSLINAHVEQKKLGS